VIKFNCTTIINYYFKIKNAYRDDGLVSPRTLRYINLPISKPSVISEFSMQRYVDHHSLSMRFVCASNICGDFIVAPFQLVHFPSVCCVLHSGLTPREFPALWFHSRQTKTTTMSSNVLSNIYIYTECLCKIHLNFSSRRFSRCLVSKNLTLLCRPLLVII